MNAWDYYVSFILLVDEWTRYRVRIKRGGLQSGAVVRTTNDERRRLCGAECRSKLIQFDGDAFSTSWRRLHLRKCDVIKRHRCTPSAEKDLDERAKEEEIDERRVTISYTVSIIVKHRPRPSISAPSSKAATRRVFEC